MPTFKATLSSTIFTAIEVSFLSAFFYADSSSIRTANKTAGSTSILTA
jgi:hypothetical protein